MSGSTLDISNVYVGDTGVTALYVGSTLVWPHKFKLTKQTYGNVSGEYVLIYPNSKIIVTKTNVFNVFSFPDFNGDGIYNYNSLPENYGVFKGKGPIYIRKGDSWAEVSKLSDYMTEGNLYPLKTTLDSSNNTIITETQSSSYLSYSQSYNYPYFRSSNWGTAFIAYKIEVVQ